MSLQFIMGPSGSGKSHYLYEKVIKESQTNPNKKYIVVVPEQFTMQTEKDLIMYSPNKGIMNIEVLSFHRLAYRVLEETGASERTVLNDVGKNFVIRKIAGDCESELKLLGSNLKKVGYISELKSLISEFTQYDVQPETLESVLKQVENSPNLYYKLADIKKVYEGFRAYLKERYITAEELLDVLASVVSQSDMLKNSVVYVDGFTGFTPIQNKLMRELMCVCETVVVTATMDKKEDPYVYRHPYQLFALSKQMISSLVELAKECKVSVLEPVLLYDVPIYRFRDNEPLQFLESHLFRYSKGRYEKEQDSVQIWCAKNAQEEVEFVAQKIRQLVRTEGYRYRDIAVLTNDISAYANHVEKKFEMYGLPVFMDHKRSILLNSFVEFIRSLLAMAEQNFTYESVFRYLRTGLTGIGRDEIDILENYVLAMGIRGYKKWNEPWIRRSNNMDEARLSVVNQIRLRFVESVTDVMEVLKNRSKTVLEVTKALHDFFLKGNLQQRVKEYQIKFEKENDLALAKEYAQVYRLVIELLDQFVELLGNERISLQEYCDLLDAGLEEAKIGVIPPSIDQVVVGDVERSRVKDVKVVFLLGANDVYIPGATAKQGLLSEYDRTQLTDGGMTLAPGAKEKTYIQKFYLYLILTKPSKQVYLTYSKANSEGKSMRPSYLVMDILKMYPLMKVREVEGNLTERELTIQSGISCLIEGLQKHRDGLSKEWQELYSWYKRNPEWSRKIEQIVEAFYYSKPESSLTRDMAQKLYGDILENSVTRLEKFSACAYQHFLTYGLKLTEREEYKFQALDLGNLFHSSIEKFSYKLERGGYTWTNIPNDKLQEFIDTSVEECIVDYGNSILYSTARNEYIITRLKRMLKRTVWAVSKQLGKGDFVPEGYEVTFRKTIQVQDLGEMRLRGKIDRMDVYEDDEHVYVKIVDYKTGKELFDLGKVSHGLQMQLVVYMNAALELQETNRADKKVVPAGIFYYNMKDPIIQEPEQGQDVDTLILKELCPDGIVQASDDVLAHLDREMNTSSEVIPVSRNKNGEFSKKSKILAKEDFATLSEFANMQVLKAGRGILQGETGIAPYSLKGKNACQYCPYHAICGFDDKIPGYEYRELEERSDEQAIEIMRQEVGE